MVIDNCNAWTVQVTFPPGSKDRAGKERRWAHNDSITVVAAGIDRALDVLRQHYPDAKVWAANHVGSRTIIIVDDTAKEAAQGSTSAQVK